MKLLQYIEKNGKVAGWSTSDTIGMEIDGKPTKSRWVEVEGGTEAYFKNPKSYKVTKVKEKDKKKKDKGKDVYKFEKKSKA